MKKYIITILLLTTIFIHPKRLHKEKAYQQKFAEYLTKKNIKVHTEYTINKSRIDILTFNYAIEVDFANNRYEAIGQALYYALISDKNPAVLLIMENEKDYRYLKELLLVAKQYYITVWTIDQNFNIKRRL